MSQTIWSGLKNLFIGQKNYPIQTLTYYIPAPPPRKSGYREKEFDKYCANFINNGFEIISINTESHTSNTSSGMWIIFTLRPTNEKASKLKVDELDNSLDVSDSTTAATQIDGLYYIDKNES